MKRILLTAALGLVTVAGYAQWSNPADEIPAYHPAPPATTASLPAILSGKQLTGPSFRYAWQVKVYKQAATIQSILFQLPCYCRCDRALGHSSLRSCFAGTHGAECSTCAQEEAYAYEMTRRGWTPKQIRQGIEHKDYEKIDLTKL
ncbi:MAG TPA: CYCXC family (seleno)protein [Acidobacteriaceae bacterium]|nr:CYCXC family (seleno)protein [Acidobacteriaceae bacterium]